jgi:predicted anti-sigma-YlaC factor YlaD
MHHLSAQIVHRFLARALKQREVVAATQHLRVCASCRENAIVLRRNRRASLPEQILPETSAGDHPSEDLLSAFVDDDLKATDRVYVKDHLRQCEVCSGILLDLRSFRDELKQIPAKQFLPGQESAQEKDCASQPFHSPMHEAPYSPRE